MRVWVRCGSCQSVPCLAPLLQMERACARPGRRHTGALAPGPGAAVLAPAHAPLPRPCLRSTGGVLPQQCLRVRRL